MGWRIVGAVGRVLMTAGTLILLFVAYQLWGTGLHEARAQDGLRDEFAQLLADAEAEATDATTTTTTTEAPDPNGPIEVVPSEIQPRLPLPAIGDPVARIEIPRIGITRTVVSGVTLDQLARGPGHYPNSPLPGQRGNVAIAGHRTTFGQPFHNVDKLEPGDQILTQTVQGEFVYRVTETVIVRPDELWVLEDQYEPGDEPTEQGDDLDEDDEGGGDGDDAAGGEGGTLAGGDEDGTVVDDEDAEGSEGTPKPTMILIACEPKYSLAKRIIVFAELEGTPAPEIEGQAEARAEAGHDVTSVDGIDAGLSGESAARTPAVLWGLAAALIWLATWLVQVLLRRRARAGDETPTRKQRLLTWSPYLVGLPLFLVALYGFFENFSRFLPGNY